MSDTYEIQKGIAPPEKAKNKKKYPYDSMEVGDSFFVDCYGDRTLLHRLRSNVLGSARQIKITTRSEGSGFRVWRIG